MNLPPKNLMMFENKFENIFRKADMLHSTGDKNDIKKLQAK
jgi:hypothetical protein